MLLRSALVIAHVVSFTPAQGSTTPAPVATSSSEAMRSEEARQLYANEKYVEAAQAYEKLYRESTSAKYLFNAAAAREAAGHDAHAYVALQAYLDHPGLNADERGRAEVRLASLRKRTSAIQIQITPTPRPPGVEVVLQRANVEALRLDAETLDALDRKGVIEIWAERASWSIEANAPAHEKRQAFANTLVGAPKLIDLELARDRRDTPTSGISMGTLTVSLQGRRSLPAKVDVVLQQGTRDLVHPATGAETTLNLPAGTWLASAQSRNLEAAPSSVEVSPGGRASVSLRLRHTPEFSATLFFSVTSLSLLTAGAAVYGVSRSRYEETSSKLLDTPGVDSNGELHPERQRVLKSVLTEIRNGGRGSFLIGASVGTGLSVATLQMKPKRDWPFLVQAGAGAIAVIVGSVIWSGHLKNYRPIVPSGTAEGIQEALNGLRPLDHAMLAVMGIGCGLITGALSALVLRRLHRRPQAKSPR